MNPRSLFIPATQLGLGCLLLALPLGCGGGSSGPSSPGGVEGLAIVSGSSDYTTSTISLAAPALDVLTTDDCIQSPNLSGDVVLPSSPQPSHELLVIDRTHSALTWLDPTSCKPKQQLSVTASDFGINPHDVVGLSATKIYVTRYNPNPTPSADPADMNQGNDILIMDPTANTTANSAFKGRIDLSSYATQVAGVTIIARPDRALLVNGMVYVTLNNISADYMTLGGGRVVIIDTTTDAVTGTIDIPGLEDCSALQYVPAAQSLFVVCGGDDNDPATQATTSGVAQIDLSTSPPSVTKTIGGMAFGSQALSFETLGMITSTVGLALTSGAFSGTPPDQLWGFDISAGTASKIADASSDLVFGSVVIDAAHQQAFLSDADAVTPVVRVFDISTPAAPTQRVTFAANPTEGRLPRSMAFY